MRAAARYLRTLRERNVGTRSDMMKKMGISDDSILERIEKVTNEPKILSYFAFIHAVGARADHVAALLVSGDGPEFEAVADEFADEVLSGADVSSDDRETRRREAIAIAELLAAHPQAFGRWLEYGDRLLGGLDDTP